MFPDDVQQVIFSQNIFNFPLCSVKYPHVCFEVSSRLIIFLIDQWIYKEYDEKKPFCLFVIQTKRITKKTLFLYLDIVAIPLSNYLWLSFYFCLTKSLSLHTVLPGA